MDVTAFSELGLITGFIGALALAASPWFGSSAGWGGSTGWKNSIWRWMTMFGWSLLSIGFLFQWIGLRSTT